MNKKQRTRSLVLGVILEAAGLGCIVASEAMQDILGSVTANACLIFGISIMIISLIYLLIKFPKMISSEMTDKAAKLAAEDCFFQRVSVPENANTLAEKFRQAGFQQKGHSLYKRQFSFLKDYMNYYVFIENDVDIAQSIDSFVKRMDTRLETKKLLHKNNYVFLIFFQRREITEQDLNILKKVIIKLDVMQELRHYAFDTIVPIIYDVETREYIVRKSRKKHSLKPINIAMNTFCKIVFNPSMEGAL